MSDESDSVLPRTAKPTLVANNHGVFPSEASKAVEFNYEEEEKGSEASNEGAQAVDKKEKGSAAYMFARWPYRTFGSLTMLPTDN